MESPYLIFVCLPARVLVCLLTFLVICSVCVCMCVHACMLVCIHACICVLVCKTESTVLMDNFSQGKPWPLSLRKTIATELHYSTKWWVCPEFLDFKISLCFSLFYSFLFHSFLNFDPDTIIMADWA